VVPELRGKLGSFAEVGIEFAFCKTADDEFNEAGFTDPDQQMITLLEARTYSPLRSGIADSVCGYFLEYRMAVSDCRTSRRFWENMGLVSAALDAAISGYAQLGCSGLNLGLQERGPRASPQLVFIHERPETVSGLLEARGIPFQRGQDHDAAQLLRITAPDGLELLIRDRD
ncbi:MAG: hypothetical protein ACRESC_00570, partial [Gammaproteobacteria bacterium]